MKAGEASFSAARRDRAGHDTFPSRYGEQNGKSRNRAASKLSSSTDGGLQFTTRKSTFYLHEVITIFLIVARQRHENEPPVLCSRQLVKEQSIAVLHAKDTDSGDQVNLRVL